MEFKPGRELEEYNYLYKEIEDVYHNLARKIGISDSAFDILYTIAALGDGCLQKDIAAKNSLSKQTVNSSIHNLEIEGLLSLAPGKGRDKHICLTEKGRAFLETHIFPIIEMENEVFSVLTPEETEMLLKLSRKYYDILQEKLGSLL